MESQNQPQHEVNIARVMFEIVNLRISEIKQKLQVIEEKLTIKRPSTEMKALLSSQKRLSELLELNESLYESLKSNVHNRIH